MFWPKGLVFNGFKRVMFVLWAVTVFSLLVFAMGNHHGNRGAHSVRPECGNRTSRQLFKKFLYQSPPPSSANVSQSNPPEMSPPEQCFAPVLLILWNVLLTLSTFRHWFQLSLFQKWFSLDYLLNLFLLLCMYGWCCLIQYQPAWNWPVMVYLGAHVLQTVLSVWHELHYYGRYLQMSLAVEDPLFDRKIIVYSIFKIIYMCSYLVAHRYPQSKCAAFSYQLYKWTLLALTQTAILVLCWCYLRAPWTYSPLSDAHLTLIVLIALLFLLCFAWRTERSLLLTYPLLGVLWLVTVIVAIQLIVGGGSGGALDKHSSSGISEESSSPPLTQSDEAMRDVLRSALDLSRSDEELSSDERKEHRAGDGDDDDEHALWMLVQEALRTGWLPPVIASGLLVVITLLSIQFVRAFKQQRAYADLFARECTKVLTQVLDQCRNKEYFVIKYNFNIKYKCCACGGLSLDLICADCHQTIFQSAK